MGTNLKFMGNYGNLFEIYGNLSLYFNLYITSLKFMGNYGKEFQIDGNLWEVTGTNLQFYGSLWKPIETNSIPFDTYENLWELRSLYGKQF